MKNPKSTTQQQKTVKAAAQGSLIDALGAVSAAIAAMPGNVAPMPRNVADAFMRADNILSMLNKQILDARGHLAQLIMMCGAGDPMAEALTMQLGALERAYAERLALLRKKREESSRKVSNEIRTEEQKLRDVRSQPRLDRRRNNGTLWLWAYLISRDRKISATRYGHVPNAA